MLDSDSNLDFSILKELPLARTRVYRIWSGMHSRCYNPNVKSYPDYGGRGIKICDRWCTFTHFLEDMGEPPIGYTIERRDNDADYSPKNCLWIPKSQQTRNTRVSRWLTINGETYCAAEWAERRGLRYGLVMKRLRDRWTPEEALEFIQRTVPDNSRTLRLTANGESHILAEWVKIRGLTKGAIRSRLARGWTHEQALGFQKAPPRSRWSKRNY